MPGHPIGPARGPLALLALLLLIAPLSISGCSRNEAIAETLPDPATVTGLIIDPDISGTLFQFQVIAPTGNPQEVTVEYSEDLGNSFQPATLFENNGSSFTVPTDGFYSLTWDSSANLGSEPQGDLLLRLEIVDTADGRSGTGVTSGIFSIGTPTAPQILSIGTPQGPAGGDIAFDISISDGNADHVTVDIDFSLDAGLTWNEATVDGSNAPLILPTSVSAITFILHWNAGVDQPGAVSPLARLRATVSDANSATVALTGIFGVNLVAPLLRSPTIGDIPDEMNGSEPFTGSTGSDVVFRLIVPDQDATITIGWQQQPGGSTIDPSTLVVTSTRTIDNVAAGGDLSSLFSVNAAGDGASWAITEGVSLPLGEVAFEARLEDQLGNGASSVSTTFQVVVGTSQMSPFDWNDSWWLEFDGDRTATWSSGTSAITVTSSIGPNGIPDHVEDLVVAGLQSLNPLPAASAAGVVARVRDWIEASVVDRIETHYGAGSGGIPGGFSSALSFAGTASNHTSALRIGGDDSVSGFVLGRAMVDHRNNSPNSNNSSSLGVFTTNLLQFYVNSFSFRQRFEPLMPGLGTPVGEHTLDSTVLAAGFTRSDPTNTASENLRYDQVWSAIDGWSRFVGVIASHEIGHSIGLCSNGAPPGGLFGGVSTADFAGPYTSPHHIDTAGLNLMASALGLSGALVSGTEAYHFNELNQAYLREWTLLDD